MKTRRPPDIILAAGKISPTAQPSQNTTKPKTIFASPRIIAAFVLAVCLIAATAVSTVHAAVWYQTSYNDFNAGSFNQTTIRSTDTAAYIELGRTGAGELSADSQTVGLYRMNDGGPTELSSTVQGSTVVALYRFNTPPAELSADGNTVGLWHMNEASWNGTAGEVDDVSSSNNNGTAVGGANTTASGMFGTRCGTFDGTDDYVNLPNMSFGTNNFTIEGWFTTNVLVHRYLIGDADVNLRRLVGIGSSSPTDKLAFWLGDGASWSESNEIRGNTPLQIGRWYYFALVRNGTNVTLYLNGKVEATDAVASGYSVPGTQLKIGTMAGIANYWNGKVDEVRISNIARSAAVICQDAGGAVDSSAFGNHGGLFIATQTYTTSITGLGNALQFDGVTDYVACGDTNFPAGNAARTIELWIKPDSVSIDWVGFFRYGTLSTGQGMLFHTGSGGNANKLELGRHGLDVTGSQSLSAGVWQHIAATLYNGDKVKFYVNGIEDGPYTLSGVNTQLSSSRIGVGGGAWGTPNFKGLMDEVRISSGALTAGQIAVDAGALVRDSSGKSPQNDGVAVSTFGTAGGLSMWTGAGGAKFGSNALQFDGVNDCVSIATTTMLNFTSSATFQGWFKTSNSGFQSLISKYQNGSNFYNIWLEGGVVRSSCVVGGSAVWNVASSTPINDGNWHNIAVTRSPQSKVIIYVDGILHTEGSDSGANISLPNGRLTLGARPPELVSGSAVGWFNGTMDEVRISTAVYNAQQIRADALGLCYVAGDFQSPVFDTGENGTVFQNIYSSSEIPTGTSLNFYVRTSSVTSPYYWTSWSGPFGDGSGLGGVTRYRYVQYRSTFTTSNTIYSALMNDCTIQYALNTVPSPTMAPAVADSQTQITWTANSVFPDSESDTGEYYLTREGVWGDNTYPESGLTANTQYSCQVKVRDTPWLKESSLSSSLSRYTLPTAPTHSNVTCDKSTTTTHTTSLFTFNTSFGAGTFQYLKYKWDTSPSFSEGSDSWSAGALSLNALTQNTSYYLHLKAYNGDDAANATTLTKGPYWYQTDFKSAVDTTDTDFNAGLVKSSVTAVGTGDPAYVEISTGVRNDGPMANWKYRRTININNALSYGLSDYQVWIPTSAFGSNWTDIRNKAQSTMADFRFTPSTATTTIPYWIDENTNTPKGFWVRVSTLPAGANTIYMYYGNPSASAGQSGDNTFIFFDDFPGTSLDVGKWTATGTGISVANSILTISVPSPSWGHHIISNSTFLNNIIIEAKTTMNGGATGTIELMVGYGDWGTDTVTWDIGAEFGTANAQQWEARYNVYNTATGNSISAVSMIYNTYDILSMAVLPSAAYFYKNGVQFANSSVNSLNNKKITIANTAEDAKVDWIRLRKYASTEPSISSVGSEEGPYFPAGEFQSRAIDTGKKGTSWGQISWGQNLPAGTSIKLKTRTGDPATPDGSWSAWNPAGSEWFTVAAGTPIASPRARYIQYISSFTTTVSTATPQLLEVNIQYATNTAIAPNLTNPADGVWTSSTQPVFKWNFVDDETDSQTGFRVQIATHTNRSASPPYGFTGTLANDSGDTSSTVTQYQPPTPLTGGIYYWLVRTSDTYGEWSVYSSTYCVKIDTSGPTGQSITSFSSGISSLTISCGGATDSGGGVHATPYYIEISSASDFAEGTASNSGWVANGYTFTGLARNKKYYAHVRARDVFSNTSGYSPTVEWRAKPGTFQSRAGEGSPTRSGANAFGFVGDANWEWEVPVKGGTLVTISAHIRYNTEYLGGTYDKPKLTLFGRGINESISATAGAENSWEQRQLSGTPSSDGILTLKAEGFSVVPGARFYVDDINVSQ